jgi:tetratricopeptide (TPR) repeat protein
MSDEEARAALDQAARMWRGGRLAEAEEICAAVRAERPRDCDAWHLSGIISLLRGDCSRAVELIQRALSLDPTRAEVLKNLAAAFSGLGRYREAKESCERALAIAPGYADAHWNRGLAALALGDFKTGWQEYEWRWQAEGTSLLARAFREPLWLGQEDIRGKTILRHAEQGIGDSCGIAAIARGTPPCGSSVKPSWETGATPLPRCNWSLHVWRCSSRRLQRAIESLSLWKQRPVKLERVPI